MQNRVNQRTVWKKLKNIQVICGFGRFYFSFKKLQENVALDQTVNDLLVPKKDEQIHFETDINRPEFKKYKINGIFQYSEMPQVFYLRNIFYYSGINIINNFNKDEMYAWIETIQIDNQSTFYKDILQKYLKANSLSENPNSIEKLKEMLGYDDFLVLKILSELNQSYNQSQTYKKIIDEVTNFLTGENKFVIDNYLSREKIEELLFFDVYYRTQVFDNGKGKIFVQKVLI